MNKYINIILLSIITTVVTGCIGSPTKLTEESRKYIKNIAIEIAEPEHDPSIYVAESEIEGLFTFAIVGTQASMHVQGEIEKGPRRLFKEYLKKNNIDIVKIVEKELKNKIRKTNQFKITGIKQADAIMKVKISYGFAQASLWSNQQRTQIYIYTDLYDRKDKLVAKMLGYTGILNERPTMTLEEIYKNSKKVKILFDEATVVAVNEIVEKMMAN